MNLTQIPIVITLLSALLGCLCSSVETNATSIEPQKETIEEKVSEKKKEKEEKIRQGKASYYADKFNGRKTSNGETYTHDKLTAAHKTLPFGTKVKVTNTKNGKSIIVTINDRGPFVKGRHLDLSKSAMIALNGVNTGVINIEYIVVEKNNPKEKKNEL